MNDDPQGFARHPRLPPMQGVYPLNENGDGLICPQCKLLYEIRDGIPIMLIEEARTLES